MACRSKRGNVEIWVLCSWFCTYMYFHSVMCSIWISGATQTLANIDQTEGYVTSLVLKIFSFCKGLNVEYVG